MVVQSEEKGLPKLQKTDHNQQYIIIISKTHKFQCIKFPQIKRLQTHIKKPVPISKSEIVRGL
jgi:hypothetical protein